ncbi:serine hydrolase domain-containing protein [Kutzneria sp. NPDC051319]|uniref:serine hydrolase domain-containing protein n=1 Tax=Kutzneria sp. NPDC051319 TaxID=3155047 RepID=UPI00344542B3
MSEHSRALPDRPSLRFLKMEAKRRVAAGEFGTLHEAQLAIAREHGFASWTALKTGVETAAGNVLPHVRWLVDRYRTSDAEGWTAPERRELDEHVAPRLLEQIPADVMTKMLRSVVGQLRERLTVNAQNETAIRAEIGGLRLEASTEEEAPYRIKALKLYPIAKRLTDSRMNRAIVTRTTGEPPQKAQSTAQRAVEDLGLPGVVLAGEGWTYAQGWKDLDSHEPLRPEHRFPVYGIAKVVTATAVVALVEDLDVRANTILRGVRLDNDEITVRDLLTHTAGVIDPEVQFAPEAPEFVYHRTVPCHHDRRGELLPSNGGYAVLGRIVADITGVPYPDAIRNLVLAPLGMDDSDFPTAWPQGGAVVTGYHLAEDGAFEEAERHVSTMAAAGGLWTTAPDLVRFGRTWTTLLPAHGVDDMLRPRAGTGPAKLGLGWLVNPGGDLYGHSGVGPGAGASLLIGLSDGEVTVAAANRTVPMEPVNATLRRPIS